MFVTIVIDMIIYNHSIFTCIAYTAGEAPDKDDLDVYGQETISSEPLSSYNFEVMSKYRSVSAVAA